MRAAVEKYIEDCKDRGMFPDEAGMKLAIGLKDRMLAKYCSEQDNPEHYQEYRDIFEDAKLEREHFLVQRMTSDNKVAQGCLNALKQPANGGYIDRPPDTGKVELTIKVAGVGGMGKFD
jgi:hypothetical protein